MDISLVDLKIACDSVPTYQYGQKYRGQTLDWMLTDSQESYARLIKDPQHLAYFESQGWCRPGAISYRINSEGFRGAEFETGGLLTLGCSFTMGIGLPERAVWPWLVAQDLNLPVANLAWGGISADTCFRMAAHWIPRLRPRLVIMLTPPPDRLEIMLDDSVAPTGVSIETIMPQSEIKLFGNDNFVKHWHLNSNNGITNRLKNQLAITALCQQNSLPSLIYCSWNAFARSRQEVGYARDYMHAGVLGHQLLAQQILKDYNEVKFA